MSTPNPYAPQNPNSPLTFEHLQQINNALKALDQAQAQAELGQSAGLDMTVQLTTIQTQRDQLRKLKQVYFPGQ
jgi:hypothetical protein